MTLLLVLLGRVPEPGGHKWHLQSLSCESEPYETVILVGQRQANIILL